jgi:hypothetical protein
MASYRNKKIAQFQKYKPTSVKNCTKNIMVKQ